ncbi:ATP-binding protein [Macrococcus epidermidis]|uniref:ATP-binding protein n=1 Tax=Macrococcus epidermidis TaxID=1902580 RepID=UPI0020B66B5D|nr:ATP-binding protein [Macrococcus epidermidis]UTH15078.1 putative DNA binding domain-containing protein [Macrococcus epidermidis]
MIENKTTAFKEKVSNQFLKTVSAYANYGNGQIIFGVSDNGEYIGFENIQKTILDIENKINDSINPSPDFTFSINRNNTICLEVTEGVHKPYLYKGKAYRRNDTATIEVDQLELKRLVLEGSNLSFEALEVKSTDLTFNTLSKLLMEKIHVNVVSDDLFKTLGIIDMNGKYNNVASIVADRNKFSCIDIARFGHSINEILDRNRLYDISILSAYQTAIDSFERYYEYEKIEGMHRNSIEIIPKDAFREALANAIIHRHWDINSHINIAMFPDKIEITSPGGLPSGISEFDYLENNVSILRNPILANIFFRLGYIEMFGTGIKRIKSAYSQYKVKPQFFVSETSIKIILPVTNVLPKVTKDESIIMETLSSGYVLSSSEIVERTPFNKSKVIRLVNHLCENGYVYKVGTGRGTKYRI